MLERPHYTPESVTRLAPSLDPVARRIRRLHVRLCSVRPSGALPERPVPPDYFAGVCLYRRILAALDGRGIRLLDPTAGRLALPARRAGRRVWLCWAPGDVGPPYWLEREEGWGSRRPVDPAGPWDPARPET